MEALGIGIVTVALVALGICAGLSWELLRRSDRLTGAERDLARAEADGRTMQANLEALDRLRRLERARANAMEAELFDLERNAGVDVQRRLLEKWKGSIEAANAAFAQRQPVDLPINAATTGEPNPVNDPGMLDGDEMHGTDAAATTRSLRAPVRD